MKLRSGFHLLLPFLLIFVLAVAACADDQDGDASTQGLPTPAPTEAPRPLSGDERAAIGEFESQLETIDAQWEEFYTDLDSWRAGLAECHPSAAQEALAGLAAAYADVVESARDLPRTSSTKALADLAITATDAEETAFRHLRDRWRAGNLSLFETVEQRRAEAALAQNSVTDMSLELRTQFENGPTSADVAAMEEFSETLTVIADDWDDFHDAYTAFAKRESKLEEEERAAGYEELVAQLGEIVSVINDLESTDVNSDHVDALQEAAEDEAAALQFLADFPPDLTKENGENGAASAPSTSRRAAAPARPAPAPQATAPAPAAEAAQPAAGNGDAAPAGTSPVATAASQPAADAEETPATASTKKLTPLEEIAAAIASTQALLVEIDQSIDDVVNDKSADNLVDIEEFDAQFERFTREWSRFYQAYDDWRATDGGCDRVGVAEELTGFSQQADALARTVRDLPQSGFLVPVYALTVEAAELESGAVRTLSNSWAPFAVDAFKAVDEARVSSNRLRRQASIALAELNARP